MRHATLTHRALTLKRILAFSGLVLAVIGPAAFAQEGHPLVGSWHGEWGVPGRAESMDLTLIIDWDGTSIMGLVNPVTDRAQLENARLDSGNWTVRFEVEVRDPEGVTRRCVADGTFDKLGSDRRELAGSWTCGSLEARFHITRDRDY